MRRTLAIAIIFAAALVAAATCVGTSASAAPRRFDYDDLFRLVTLSRPQLSPDGTRVVVAVSVIDRRRNRRVRFLDLIRIADGTHRVIARAQHGSDPRWSPSGDRIAFIADARPTARRGEKGEMPQVWIAAANGGGAKAVTDAPGGVEQFVWRPDGKAIAYVAVDPEPKKTGDAKFVDAYVVGNDSALAHGAARPARVWLQPLSGRTARRLTSGAGSVTYGEAATTLSFSRDGTTLAYLHAPTPVLNDADDATIRLIEIASGRERALGASSAHEGNPIFSDRGRLAYLHSEGDGQTHPVEAYVTDTRGGPSRSVSHAIDRAVRDIAWEPGGETLDALVNDGTHEILYRIAPGTAPERVATGDLNIDSGLEGALGRGGTLAFIGSTSTRPDELYYAAPGQPAKQLTHYNDAIAALDLGSSERITFPTTVGVDGDAVLTKPPGFTPNSTYPLVLMIHGGPTQASTQTFFGRTQLMAAHGWLVLQPNYRGSTNLGERYQKAIWMDTVEGPGHDIRAALDAVKARRVVDEQRVAVSGWSYGGIMTTWLIAHYHDWRCAVAGAPVTDVIADYATADDINADRELMRGSPWIGNNRADYLAQSPITYVADVTTPLLLMTDRGDQRVSPVGAYEFYHALRDLGRPVQLVAYPVDGHFPADPVRAADVNRRWVQFIADHM